MMHLTWSLYLMIIVLNNTIYCEQESFNDTKETSVPGQHYDFNQEYSANFNKIFSQYLKINNNNKSECNQSFGSANDLNETDFNIAIEGANKQINEFEENNRKYFEAFPSLLNFSPDIYLANLRSKYNEYITKNLVNRKCMNKYEAELNLPTIKTPNSLWEENFCDLDSEVSLTVKCDPNYKYRREDGKCNNLINTNWGSNFQCQRRLLPPDYADGVSAHRVAIDGSELPNSRLLTNFLMPDIKEYDFERNLLHIAWGQYVVHDSFKTLQFWGFGIPCCNHTLTHEECFETEPIPQDILTKAYNQSCINFVRSIGCNTCSLGHREQLNAATSTLDLSHLYGGNQNNTNNIRSFVRGELRGDIALDGSDILPRLVLSSDLDKIDSTNCNPSPDRSYLGCFLVGDGIRGNQQPIIMALHVILRRRHNHHAKALSKVNPHWNDDRLYQEARRILIAENNKINYDEYFPTILSREQLNYYQLNTKYDGFTQYNPKVNPTVIQSVGVAAFRFGHSQIASHFPVIKRSKSDSHSFQLRFKFNEMSEIWDGNTNGIIAGMETRPARAVDSYLVTDIHNYLFFSPQRPEVIDLATYNIKRGRDHGIPGYIYYVEYCTRIQIKSWKDLIQLIPEDYVNKMASFYKDVRDIDLFVGGIAERQKKGSLLGPTFSCLIAIQIYHWKYGDRFYFEHGGQSGSFTIEQLNNIRKISSFGNLLCKTTDFDFTYEYPMLLPSKLNKKISCLTIPDLNYSLWREKKNNY